MNVIMNHVAVIIDEDINEAVTALVLTQARMILNPWFAWYPWRQITHWAMKPFHVGSTAGQFGSQCLWYPPKRSEWRYFEGL